MTMNTASMDIIAMQGTVGAMLAELPGRLRLGTRRSPLARTQSQWVADRLIQALGALRVDIEVELVEVTTTGDVTSAPLASLGGTGVFVSALREAVLAEEIDFAVHSLKDLPTGPAESLVLAALPPREDPRDVLVARDGLTLAELPAGARLGTGSPRRAAQLRSLGLGLEVVGVRGNVDTRLRKVTDGELDAVVLARAGLLRLGRAGEATESFDPQVMLPAPGQGALAVEARSADLPLRLALALLDDVGTRATVHAERALLARLEAGCSAPVGALAEVRQGALGPELVLRAVVAAPDGSGAIRRSAVTVLDSRYDPEAECPVPPADRLAAPAVAVLPTGVGAAIDVGRSLAEQMLDDGAADLIPASTLPVPQAVSDAAAMAREGDS
jgi:hydroxymethylbilane synthase